MKKIFYLSVLFLNFANVQAQIRKHAKFPTSTVRNICIDHRDNTKYFITKKGLIQIRDSVAKADSLPNYEVYAIDVAHSDTASFILGATKKGEGLILNSLETETAHSLGNDQHHRLQIEFLAYDKFDKDYVWLGTQTHGLYLLYRALYKPIEKQNKFFRAIRLLNRKAYEFNDVLFLQNQVLIATDQGLFVVNRKNARVRHYLRNQEVLSLAKSQNILWAGGDGVLWTKFRHKKGMRKWDKVKGINRKNIGRVEDIAVDKEGRAWLVGEMIISCEKYYHKKQTILNYCGKAEGFDAPKSVAIGVDAKDQVWVGTVGNGIYSFDPKKIKNKTVKVTDLEVNYKKNNIKVKLNLYQPLEPDEKLTFKAIDSDGKKYELNAYPVNDHFSQINKVYILARWDEEEQIFLDIVAGNCVLEVYNNGKKVGEKEY